ncbi:MAG: hypothetical protein ACE5EY_04755 [Anaerolineae bacterium]
MKKNFMYFGVLALLFFMVACRQEESSTNNTSTEVDVPFAVEGEWPSSPAAQGWITDAATDLAAREGVGLSDVAFMAFELPVWPDASYGCPQPEQVYQQVPKEGYQIQLRVNGRDFFYHGGEDIEQFLCESE